MKKTFITAFALTLLLNTAPALTDIDPQALRGSTGQQVESRHGQPERIEGPVGEPPITRWIYPEFTVVFEYDRVVHAFARQPEVENRSAGSAPSRPGSGDTLNLSD